MNHGLEIIKQYFSFQKWLVKISVFANFFSLITYPLGKIAKKQSERVRFLLMTTAYSRGYSNLPGE